MPYFNFVPTRVDFYGEFHAPDPWAGGEQILWSLEGYLLVSRRFALFGMPKGRLNDQPTSKPTRNAFAGIRATTYNRYRILPLAVHDLWVENRVAPADLPWLLNEMEGKLRLSDYPPALMRTYFILTSVMFGILAVIVAAIYIYNLAAGQIYDPRFIWIPVMMVIVALVMFIGLLLVKMRRKTIRERALDLLAKRAGQVASK